MIKSLIFTEMRRKRCKRRSEMKFVLSNHFKWFPVWVEIETESSETERCLYLFFNISDFFDILLSSFNNSIVYFELGSFSSLFSRLLRINTCRRREMIQLCFIHLITKVKFTTIFASEFGPK